MSKRKPVFLGIEERVVHGQIVDVSVYGEIDPDPTLDCDALLTDICGAGPERLKEITARVNKYKDQLFDAKHPELAEFDFSEGAEASDDFLDTAAENAERAEWVYREETVEKFVPLDRALKELGIE